jgi:hypothetical protein
MSLIGRSRKNRGNSRKVPTSYHIPQEFQAWVRGRMDAPTPSDPSEAGYEPAARNDAERRMSLNATVQHVK